MMFLHRKRVKMIKMKIPEVQSRKNRILRSRAFFLEVDSNTIKTEDRLKEEQDRITNIMLFNPWHRPAFCLISN